MKKDIPWHDDDSLWRDIQPFVFSQAILDNAAAEIEDAVKLLDITPPARGLDLCCGVGRHTLELAARGFAMTGVDRTAHYIEQARVVSRDIEFLVDDMRSFCRDTAFDFIINMYTSFGYFEDDAEERRVLENMHRSLRPGGKAIIELMGKEVLARIFQMRDWQELDGVYKLDERIPSRDWSCLENRWLLIKDGKVRTITLSLRMYSAQELRQLLTDVGFRTVSCFGSLQGEPYDHKAKWLIVVAEK